MSYPLDEHGIGPEQLRWLREHVERLVSPANAAGAKLTAEQRALITGQLALRERAKARFPDPERWLWSDRSLSQASDWMSAVFKSGYFAGRARIIDACCGAGVDTIALAHRGCQVTAIDANAEMALLTKLNAELHGVDVATIPQELSSELMRELSSDHDGLHIDPDRRPADRRTLCADAFSPPIAEVLTYATEFPTVVIKLAPSTLFLEADEESIHDTYCRVWLASRGECRQQLLVKGVAGCLAGERQAVLLDARSDGTIGNAVFAPPRGVDTHGEVCFSPRRYVYDLHAVLHAADLYAAWGAMHGLQAIGESHSYYTGDHRLADNAWCQCFEVLDVLAWDDRRVRRWLRGVQAGVVEVKCRQVKLDANAFQRRYSREGGQPITLLVTRLDGRVRAIAARRC